MTGKPLLVVWIITAGLFASKQDQHKDSTNNFATYLSGEWRSKKTIESGAYYSVKVTKSKNKQLNFQLLLPHGKQWIRPLLHDSMIVMSKVPVGVTKANQLLKLPDVYVIRYVGPNTFAFVPSETTARQESVLLLSGAVFERQK
ncbi:hypothetical protein [Hymenobacter metallilatus]|uniref:Uncharacterized protein n=1 Tax=Hymenobacter metallilatus TaxID=2493666 RepID=A0A3R9M7R5_9BACT|nr:hypothetical protein [Hymenobacter metallilatus]RSK24359.1 hypothetical protein EI290_20340 [Hymenobacter metallilatus]